MCLFVPIANFYFWVLVSDECINDWSNFIWCICRRIMDDTLVKYYRISSFQIKYHLVVDFNEKAQNTLYAETPICEITRARCDTLLNHGLEKGTIKNNYTLLSKPWYDRRWTGAARAAIKMMDDLFWKDGEVKEVSRVEALTTENLIIGWWFRMVPNMQRLPNLQRRFQKIYMNK